MGILNPNKTYALYLALSIEQLEEFEGILIKNYPEIQVNGRKIPLFTGNLLFTYEQYEYSAFVIDPANILNISTLVVRGKGDKIEHLIHSLSLGAYALDLERFLYHLMQVSLHMFLGHYHISDLFTQRGLRKIMQAGDPFSMLETVNFILHHAQAPALDGNLVDIDTYDRILQIAMRHFAQGPVIANVYKQFFIAELGKQGEELFADEKITTPQGAYAVYEALAVKKGYIKDVPLFEKIIKEREPVDVKFAKHMREYLSDFVQSAPTGYQIEGVDVLIFNDERVNVVITREPGQGQEKRIRIWGRPAYSRSLTETMYYLIEEKGE